MGTWGNQHLFHSKTIRSSLMCNNQMLQQMDVSETLSLGQLIIPSMGTIQINDNDTLAIARTYLDILEKKIKENTDLEN